MLEDWQKTGYSTGMTGLVKKTVPEFLKNECQATAYNKLQGIPCNRKHHFPKFSIRRNSKNFRTYFEKCFLLDVKVFLLEGRNICKISY